MKLVALCLLALSCAKAPQAETIPATPQEVITYSDAVARALTFFDAQGFPVSRRGVEEKNQGDGLIFLGLAMAGLPCAEGMLARDAAARMITELSGGLYRHPTLADQISLDGPLGLYRGIAARVKNCGERAYWQPLLDLHMAFLRVNGYRLNASSDVTIPLDFRLVPAALAGEKLEASQTALEFEVASWAAAVRTAREGSYRINLGLLTFEALEDSGTDISANGRNAFCSATRGTDLPTVEQWCGRNGLEDFLGGFVYNVWQYRHQRTPAWESEDGNGDEQPGFDFLIGWVSLHGFQTSLKQEQ